MISYLKPIVHIPFSLKVTMFLKKKNSRVVREDFGPIFSL